MLDNLRKTFRAQPRVIEAYVIGEHLVPEDGTDPWDASSIVVVLEPPLDTSTSESRDADLSALIGEFRETGWERDRDRSWTFSTTEASKG